jgi:molybdopterin-guanine dinucleotide biosynthesis protein B
MKVVGLCGASGSGKTQLAEALIAGFKASGAAVSVVKHAHKRFDIDIPGKDSYRHRQAGAFEVVVANSQRLALVREFSQDAEPTVHQLLAELIDLSEFGREHWVLVEGFKHADLPKIEVWRVAHHPQQSTGASGVVAAREPTVPLYPNDPLVVAVATDNVASLPAPTGLPVLDLNQPAAVLAFLRQDAGRYEYLPPTD